MTWNERESIFSKDVMTLDEFMAVMCMDRSTASTTMKMIKNSLSKPRVEIAGKLHVQDFIDYYRLDMRRYTALPNATVENDKAQQNQLDQIARIRGSLK